MAKAPCQEKLGLLSKPTYSHRCRRPVDRPSKERISHHCQLQGLGATRTLYHLCELRHESGPAELTFAPSEPRSYP